MDCPHKNAIKIFIIKRQEIGQAPDHAGYSICPDCNDYLVTGWVNRIDVWITGDVYSMNEIIADGDVEETTPIEMFLDWIRSDLISRTGEVNSQVLPP